MDNNKKMGFWPILLIFGVSAVLVPPAMESFFSFNSFASMQLNETQKSHALAAMAYGAAAYVLWALMYNLIPVLLAGLVLYFFRKRLLIQVGSLGLLYWMILSVLTGKVCSSAYFKLLDSNIEQSMNMSISWSMASSFVAVCLVLLLERLQNRKIRHSVPV